jgi:hypothetical protein
MHVILSQLPSDSIHIHYLVTTNVIRGFESNGLFVNFACVSQSQADVEKREYKYCYRFRDSHIYLVITYFCHFNYIISILLCPKDVEAVGLLYHPHMLLKKHMLKLPREPQAPRYMLNKFPVRLSKRNRPKHHVKVWCIKCF